MVRLIATTVVELVANAIGLPVAKWLLAPEFTLTPAGFVGVIVVSTPTRFILAPLIFKLAPDHRQSDVEPRLPVHWYTKKSASYQATGAALPRL